MTEEYLDYKLDIQDIPGDPCCTRVILTKANVEIRNFTMNKMFIASLVTHWTRGIDVLEKKT